LGKSNTRRRFREFVVVRQKCFVAGAICFVAGAEGIGYDSILARPMPPPSDGKASFMRGHFHHRANCPSSGIRRGCDLARKQEVPSMKLSAPLYHLKRKAKLLSRAENMPLHEALDRVARQQGFAGWSLLAAKAAAAGPAEKLFARLAPGDLVLLGARPGHGKP
jgi:hypothetical protein